MLYQLLYPLRELFFGFNVFKYITFRAAMGSLTSFLICVIFGPWFVRTLMQLKIGENIIDEKLCPQLHSLHRQKKGIPTMGGLLIVFSIVVSTLLWAKINKYILLTICSFLWLGMVGFLDDYLKFIRRRSNGMTMTTKFIGQLLLATIIGLIAFHDPHIACSGALLRTPI